MTATMAQTSSTTNMTASASGQGQADAGKAAMMLLRRYNNIQGQKYYAAALCGLIAVFVVLHWTRWLCVRGGARSSRWTPLRRPFVITSRLIRNVLVRRVPGFTSAGHALTVTVFVAINVAVTFTRVDLSSYGNLGNRLGWMAVANLCFLVFLALKNTPLALLTAYSYERLNCLHQVAGYTVFVMMALHGIMYTALFGSSHRLVAIYSEWDHAMGIVAGFGFLGAVLSAVVVRRFWYEAFYVLHIFFWIVSIVAVGLHQPFLVKRIIIITALAASMWIVDRIVRAVTILYYGVNNEVTLHPLPNGATKILMKKVSTRAVPGKHCFVWIPAVRRFETHPFTIVSSKPYLEFTVRARDGFTRDLHEYAVAHPGVAVRASVDGFYGTFPNPNAYDKLVLIAGGGGATFTFGLAVNVLESMTETTAKDIVFIWTVREHENLAWFKEHLDMLSAHALAAKLNMSIYVTRATPMAAPMHADDESHDGTSEKQSPAPSLTGGNGSDHDVEKSDDHGDVEKNGEIVTSSIGTTTTTTTTAHLSGAVKAGRPNLARLITDAVKSTPSHHRVLIAACGPTGMMHVVRDTSAGLIRGDGPGIELHCEQFGW